MTTENHTTVRRPVGLWILVGVYSTLILLSYGMQVYLRFDPSFSHIMEAKYADWTLLDYVFNFYPGILILLGCLGLVMMKRWAVYVFGLLFALRLREFGMVFFRDVAPESSAMVWGSRGFALFTAAVAFFYAFHLWRKGTLRPPAASTRRRAETAPEPAVPQEPSDPTSPPRS